MIKTLEQAQAVQERRFNQGLKGRSKAVRRYIKRSLEYYSLERLHDALPANFEGCQK